MLQDTRKLSIGDSTRGYDSCMVTTDKNGKYRLVAGSILGRKWHLKRAIAALNRGSSGYTTKTGDQFGIHLSRPK